MPTSLRGSTTIRSALPVLNLAAVFVIVVLDWMTPAGVVVGILLTIPIMLASAVDHRRYVWLVFGAAVLGKALASLFGAGPLSPAAVWIPNRIFAFLALPASLAISLHLQDRRLEAERARDLNRLLVSLLAHDLRTPLVLAYQGLEYAEQTLARKCALRQQESSFLADLRTRLRRSLDTIESLMELARSDLHSGSGLPGNSSGATSVAAEVEANVASFLPEAAARGKTLVVDVKGVDGGDHQVEGAVLRQALSILVDNAIRHASPGPVHVTARADGREIVVRVADTGPGLSGNGRGSAQDGQGSGVGLELCRALARRAGGRLEVEKDSPEGTTFALHLPATPSGSGR